MSNYPEIWGWLGAAFEISKNIVGARESIGTPGYILWEI